MVAGVLAPGGGEPVCGDTDRVGGADDPAEEAGAGFGVKAGLGEAGEGVDGVGAGGAVFGEGGGEGLG